MGFWDKVTGRGSSVPVSAGYVTINGQRRDLAELLNPNAHRQSAVLAACIDKIVETATTTPAQVVTQAGVPVDGHPLTALLTGNVNPDLSSHQFLAWVYAALKTPRGQAFAYIARKASRSGKPDISDPTLITGLHPILDACEPVFDTKPTRENPSPAPTGFKARVGNVDYTYAPHEILWFRKGKPDNPYVAVNPLKPAEPAVTISHQAMEFLASALTDGATAGGILHMGDLSDPNDPEYGKAVAEKAHRKMTGPANAKRVVITSGAVKPAWVPFGLSPVDLALIEVLEMTDKQVVMATGVPRDLVFSESKYENRDAAMTELWESANIPLQRIVGEELTTKLMPFQTDVRVDWDRDAVEALQPRNEDRATKASQTNAVLVDEVRAMLNLPPLPDGAGQVLPAALLANQRQKANPIVAPAAKPGAGDPDDQEDDPTDNPDGPEVSTDVDTRTAAQRAADDFDPATTRSVYARLERRGMTAMAELAAAQLEDVLNRLDRAANRADMLTSWREDAQAYLTVYTEHQRANPGAPFTWQPTVTERASINGVFNPDRWATRTKDILRPWIERAHQTGAEDTARELQVPIEDVEDQVEEETENRLAVAAALIGGTTAALIAAALADQALETLDAVKDRVLGIFTALGTGARAVTAAQVETVQGYTAGQDVVGAHVAASGPVSRRWWTRQDDQVRPTHAAQHGHVLTDWAATFPNGLRRPGDPAGPPEEVAGCRCVMQVYAAV